MLCLPLRLLRCGVCGLRFVAFALFAFLVPVVAPLGLALFGLRCVVRLRLLVGVAFLFPLCPLSVVRALFGLFVLLSFVVVLVLFALFGAGFLQHRPNYNLLLKESKKMLYEFTFVYCYKIEEKDGTTDYACSDFPLWAESWAAARETAKLFAFQCFGGLCNPFTIYGGAQVTLLHYFVKWKINP